MEPDVLNKIKNVGYWRVHFRPVVNAHLQLSDCQQAVEESTVMYRGWDFPHVSRGQAGTSVKRFGDFVQEECDWHHHVEFWRMYKSSQFLSYRALSEDLYSSDYSVPKNVIGIGGAIFSFTEFVGFLAALSKRGFYKQGVYASFTLFNCAGRQLWIDSNNRIPFSYARETHASEVNVERQFDTQSLLNEPTQIISDLVFEFFDHFGWKPDQARIRGDIESARSGRL